MSFEISQGGNNRSILSYVKKHNPHIKDVDAIVKIISTTYNVERCKQQLSSLNVATTVFLDFNDEFNHVIGVQGAFKNVKEVLLFEVDVGRLETLRIGRLPDKVQLLCIMYCVMQTLDVHNCNNTLQALAIQSNTSLITLVGLDALNKLTTLDISNNKLLSRVPSFSRTVQSLTIHSNMYLQEIPLQLSSYRSMSSIFIKNNMSLGTSFLLTINDYVKTVDIGENAQDVAGPGSPEV